MISPVLQSFLGVDDLPVLQVVVVPFDPGTDLLKGALGENVLYPLRALVRAAVR